MKLSNLKIINGSIINAINATEPGTFLTSAEITTMRRYLYAPVIGVLIGWSATNFSADILDNLGYGFLSPHYSWTLFVGLILFATFTGAISGMIPAWRASKINAVDALRHE